MPVIKPISGHTPVRPAMNYLQKRNRATAVDFINIDSPDDDRVRLGFDWAKVMDQTRRGFGNDRPWRGMRVRTYKHYIISPDPKDRINLADLRHLATSWSIKHFGEYEVAIVYHDDNERRIPHAHVVVNNTNLETGRRLQDPDPAALNRSLQKMASEMGLGHFQNVEGGPASSWADNDRRRPRSLQGEYVRRAEAELVAKGEYSWTADIRARVRIARMVARSETEFRGVLSAMGVSVADNSPKAARRDWVYSFVDHPTRRVSGEKLGLSYGRERLLSSFRLGAAGHLPDASEREIARIAKDALEVGDLEGLRRLSRAVSLIDSNGLSSMRDLERFKEAEHAQRAWTDPDSYEVTELVRFIEESGILPASTPRAVMRTPASERGEDERLARGFVHNLEDASRELGSLTQSHQHDASIERGSTR